MPILTTANNVKKGVMWCEDADEVTQKGLDELHADWDTVLPVSEIMRVGGLGNGLLALGAPLPRYKKQAEAVEIRYLRRLYDEAADIVERHGFTMLRNPQWIGNPARAVTCIAHAKIWMDVKLETSDAGTEQLAQGMAFIYGANKELTLRTVMGTRCIATGQRLLEGEEHSQSTIHRLRKYLEVELANV